MMARTIETAPSAIPTMASSLPFSLSRSFEILAEAHRDLQQAA